MPAPGAAGAIASWPILIPARIAHRVAVLRRRSVRAFAGARPKALTLAMLGAASLALGLLVHPAAAAVTALPMLWLGARWVADMLERPIGLRRLSGRAFPLDDIAPARETLTALGLEASAVERIMAAADAGAEVALAEFDQENRLVSEVGPIPYFASTLIARAEFIPRLRHKLELVVAHGVVAVRKAYNNPVSIQNEALSLAAIAHLPGVPRIVALDWRTRVMYQSFLLGDNLGSLMVEKGASVLLQHRLATDRPRPGTWTKASVQGEPRAGALRALAESAPACAITELAQLLERIHEAGVALGDIKYGNVLVRGGHPVLCDFDWSRVFDRRDIALLGRRDDERDLFNYLFDGDFPTLGALRAELDLAIQARPELADAIVDFGAGLRIGQRWTVSGGTGRWLAVRRHLPPLRGRSVIDLGSRDPIVALGALRAGAARVTLLQPDATLARFARACHRLVEHVDNRRYAFEVIEAEVGPAEHAAADVAFSAGGPGSDPARTERSMRALNFAVSTVRLAGSHPLLVGRRGS